MRNLHLTLAAIAVVAVAGCSGSSGPSTAPTQPAPTTTSATTAPPSPATPQAPTSTAPASPTIPPSSPPPSRAAAAPRCTTSSLRLSRGQGGAAAGTDYVSLVFTNTGSAPCTLQGYPGVSFLDGNGNQVGVPAARTRGERIRAVTIAPGGNAFADLGMPNTGNFSDADCRPAKTAAIRAYPPSETASLTVAASETVCTTKAGRPSIGPVRPGAHG